MLFPCLRFDDKFASNFVPYRRVISCDSDLDSLHLAVNNNNSTTTTQQQRQQQVFDSRLPLSCAGVLSVVETKRLASWLIVQRAPLGGGGNAACARGGDTCSRASVQPWQRPCITAVMWDQVRTTPHGDRRLPGRRRNPSFSRCVRRSSGVRGLTVSLTSGRRSGSSGAPRSSLLSPRLVCRLLMLLCRSWWITLVEAMEKEEDARMGQVEDMMFSGQSVSAADREAWRRWAQAGSTQRRRKRKKKKKDPKTSLRHAAPVSAVLRRVRGGASVPVHRQSGGYFSCFTETGLTVQNCAEDRRLARCISWIGWDTARRCATDRCLGLDSAENLWRFRSCSRCSSWNVC